MRSLPILLILVLASSAVAAGGKRTTTLRLGDTDVLINIVENDGSDIVFFAPHYNEQLGSRVASQYVTERGGRFVQIVSTDPNGRPARNLSFSVGGKRHSVDPNRIFTPSGRSCSLPADVQTAAAAFADQLLDLLFAGDPEPFRTGKRQIVAVHNNADVDGKPASGKTRDLTATAFLKTSGTHGPFAEQAAGAFLSNLEDDPDNFVLLNSPDHVGFFGGFGFNVVVQRPAANLWAAKCSVDDGSMSVYTALNRIPYICLEADAVNGESRQRQMFEAVYELLSPRSRTPGQIEPPAAGIR